MQTQRSVVNGDVDEYLLVGRGEVLGRVEVPGGARPGHGFEGYFHPTPVFQRVAQLRGWGGRALVMPKVRVPLELRDAAGRAIEAGPIQIQRARLGVSVKEYELYGHAEMGNPFDDVDAGIDVSPYRLEAKAPAGAQEHASDDELEWEGDTPTFGERLELWRRGMTSECGDTLIRVLDLACQLSDVDPEEMDLWIQSVQHARADGTIEPGLAEYLIWRIVGSVEELALPELGTGAPSEEEGEIKRVTTKYGMQEARQLDELPEPPDEWLDLDVAADAGRAYRLAQVFRLAGETSIETALRDRPDEFAAHMAAWDERIRRADAASQRESDAEELDE